MKITKSDIGKLVTFDSYNGCGIFLATITDAWPRKGMVKLNYYVPSLGRDITAHVPKKDWGMIYKRNSPNNDYLADA